MEHTGSIIASLLALAVVGYLAYRIRREREILRERIAICRDRNDGLMLSLDHLVLSGQLTPVAVNS